MIELFNGSTSAQTEKHCSTVRTLIPIVTIQSFEDDEFYACVKQCTPPLRMFTDEVGIDLYKNDWFRMYMNKISGGSITLAIVVNGIEIAITDSTYGAEYDGDEFYGYMFTAFAIWTAHGYGNYQAVMRKYDANDNLVKEDWYPCFKIQKYSAKSANGTVVIETRKNGTLRNGNDYSDLTMTGPYFIQNWSQRIRLPGRLKRSGFPVELSGVTMNNATQTRRQVFDTMGESFDLDIHLVSSEQINPVIFDDLFANIVYVTDYNVYNFESYKSIRLVRESIEFQPRVRKRNSFTFKMINEEKKNEKYND